VSVVKQKLPDIPNQQPPEQANVEQHSVEAIHKTTIKPIVTKILSIYTSILILLNVSWSMNSLIVLIILVMTGVFNITFDNKIFGFKFAGRKYALSSDASDACRWIVNIIFADVPLSLLMDLQPLALAGFWTLVLVSIVAETYQRKHRYFVFGIAFCASVVCMIVTADILTLHDLEFWIINQLAISAFFVSIEAFWNDATVRHLDSEQSAAESKKRLEEAMAKADSLRRLALVGEHARIISHEVTNLIMGFELISQVNKSAELDSMRTGLNYLQLVSRLVLDDIQVEPLVQKSRFDDLLMNVDQVLGKQISKKRIEWVVSRDSVPAGISFFERSGSTYLILQNIIKNAREAVQRKHSNFAKGKIRLECTLNGDALKISVFDNGDGLTDLQLHEMRHGLSRTHQIDGHGIGMHFVFSECKKNSFSFHANRTPSGETEIGITVNVNKF
jgi:signal transduction histidine kinase